MRDTLKTARLRFDTRLAEVLVRRPDMSYDEIGKAFGVSETAIRGVLRRFNLGARKRGPKPGKPQKQVSRG
jgi:transposase